jgi:hypothetical protein
LVGRAEQLAHDGDLSADCGAVFRQVARHGDELEREDDAKAGDAHAFGSTTIMEKGRHVASAPRPGARSV